MDPEFEFDDTDDTDTDDTPEVATEIPKQLRQAAAAGKKAKAEVARLAKENALLKAGVDVESPLGAMFARGYDGDLATEAVKASWAAVGGSGTATPSVEIEAPGTPDPDISDEERGLTAQRQMLANGSPADTPANTNPHPVDEMRKVHSDVIANGGRSDDALAAGIGVLLKAGANGDKRVLIENQNR